MNLPKAETEEAKAEAVFRETLFLAAEVPEHIRACLFAAADSWARAKARAAVKALRTELAERGGAIEFAS